MKLQILIPLIMLVLGFSSCNTLELEEETPKCMKKKINNFKKEKACDNGANVEKYTFQGKIVYVFGPGTCGADMTAEVLDVKCNSIGFLGGIRGNTAINGEEFSNATFESLIWER